MRSRRIALVALGVAAVVLLGGCAGGFALVEKDAGTSLTVSVGQTFTVTLPSNRTTGFGWAVTDPGPVAQVGEARYEEPNSRGRVGSGGAETFTFKGKSAGTGMLTLGYRRPWETGVPPEKTWSVTVIVR